MEIDSQIASQFSDQARRALRRAEEEARRLWHEYVGTEHLLLALAREDAGLAAQVLAGLGVSWQAICQELEKIVLPGPHYEPTEKLPTTPRTKKAIQYAVEEARNVKAEYVGTEYLLLGLVREGEGVAAQVLFNLGVGLDAVRRAISLLTTMELPPGEAQVEPPTPFASFTDRARRVIRLADEEAGRLGHGQVSPEHVFLAILRDGQGVAALALTNLGVELRAARLAVEGLVPAGSAPVPSGRLPPTPAFLALLERAGQEARSLGHRYYGTEHLLLALLHEQGILSRALGDLGVRSEDVRREIGKLLGGTPPEPAQTATLFDRFTGQARRVILLAHREAHRLSHDYIGTEHILLGVLHEGTGGGARLLAALSVDVGKVREEVGRLVQQGGAVQVSARLPLTPPARRALRCAQDAATRLHHARVGPEHLLLGLLHQPESDAAQVLLGLGLDLEKLREEILKRPPADDRDTMLQAQPGPAPALAPDPSAEELQGLVAADLGPPNVPASALTAHPAALPVQSSASEVPILSGPNVVGLHLQVRVIQTIFAALAGACAGIYLGGCTGGMFGLLVGISVAAIRSTAIGVVVGMLAGAVVGTHRREYLTWLPVFTVLAGIAVGCCMGDLLRNFAPLPERSDSPEHDLPFEIDDDDTPQDRRRNRP
ncbi:MAG: hypothetical protein L0Z62_22685 [Gemmataceae bacterium]|nr:hypothetical protein [Gemmataceae bacterium]